MICPNCGRRNSPGATFCSRCRQRLPLANKLNGNQRRTVLVEPRGGGGSGAIVLGVALLAGFLFIGGAAAIYLSSPPASPDGSFASSATGTPSLPAFVQPTATPSPTPTFILLPSDSPLPSFSALPTVTPVFPPTTPPTRAPRTPAPPPTPEPVVAKFVWSQTGTSMEVTFSDRSTGGPTQWQWDFGDHSGPSPEQSQQNPSHTYAAYGQYTVKLIVTGPGGTSTRTKPVNVQAPPCTGPNEPPGCIASPPPTAPPTPTPTPSPSPSAAPSASTATSLPLGESPAP